MPPGACEGKCAFDWLDEAVSSFASRGIDAVLCPISCPPHMELTMRTGKPRNTASSSTTQTSHSCSI